MRFFQTMAVAAVVCATVVLTTYVSLHGQGAAPKAVKVAVVDVQKIFNSLDEKAAMDADLNTERGRLQKEEQERTKAIQNIKVDLDILNPESAEFKKKREEFDQKAIELNVWKEYQQRKLERETTISFEALYIKVVETISREAERVGYDLVLFKDDLKSVRSQNLQQLSALISGKKVLYSEKSLEITDVISQKMNNEWNNRKGGKPAGGN